MLHRMYTVYDAKAEHYLLPFFVRAHGHAVRLFTESANTPDHEFCKHAEDYTLFQMGVYDDESARFDLLPTPEPVVKALEVRRQQELPLFEQAKYNPDNDPQLADDSQKDR